MGPTDRVVREGPAAASVKGNRRLARSILLFASLLVPVLAGEFVVRAMFGAETVLYPRNHAEARYGDYVIRRLTPNYTFWHESQDGRWRFVTNAQGFRAEHDFTYEKPAGVYRVVVVGDSNTQGFEVHQHETYSAVLEKRLRDRGVNAEVINAGVSGFGTAEELVFLENEGFRYHPDAIVVGYFANDPEDSARSGLFRLEDGKLVEASKTHAPAVGIIRLTQLIPGLKWLGENSYAYSILFNGVWDFMKARSVRQATQEYATKVNAPSTSMEDLTVALLRRVAASSQRSGSRTILLDIPFSDGKTGYVSSMPAALRSQVVPAFQDFLAGEEILRDLPAGTLTHVPHGQRHINAVTHARIAAAIDRLLATPDTLSKSAVTPDIPVRR